MPRLFTGLELPRPIAEDLSLLRGGLTGARWIDPENYHITLRFIGDVDDQTAGDIAELLAGLRRRTVEVTLTGLAHFGGDKPRALIASVKASRELMELQADHERVMRRLGMGSEHRKFVPHITLARLTRETSVWGVADYIALRGLFMQRSFFAPRFILYSSRDSVGGGPYLAEEIYPLTPLSQTRPALAAHP